MNFISTLEIPLSPIELQRTSFENSSKVKLWDFTFNLVHRLRALYAQSFRITLALSVLPRLLAQSLPGLLLRVPSLSSSTKEFYDQNSLHHSRDIAGSGFRPLSKIPHCCLPKKSGPCLSPSVADHPLRPAKDRRLGRLLLYQQPNPTQAHLIAINLSII